MPTRRQKRIVAPLNVPVCASLPPPLIPSLPHENHEHANMATPPQSSAPFATEVLPFLFVGSQSDAYDQEKLEQHGIEYILTVAKESQPPSSGLWALPHITQLTVPLQDHPEEELEDHLPQALAFIEEARRRCGKVLVHCMSGICRSPTVVIAYLIAHHKYCLHSAKAALEHKIGDNSTRNISLRFTFWLQLQQFQQQHQTIGSPQSSSSCSSWASPCSSSVESSSEASSCFGCWASPCSVPRPKPNCCLIGQEQNFCSIGHERHLSENCYSTQSEHNSSHHNHHQHEMMTRDMRFDAMRDDNQEVVERNQDHEDNSHQSSFWGRVRSGSSVCNCCVCSGASETCNTTTTTSGGNNTPTRSTRDKEPECE
eukprot:TRINITY_DN67728_c8_g2_i1.p1 TRINITY_DN67728_c8_g2~~TRINITY_DN67728_c8_g2_i1.p1  ORF type:complete len:370 (-),score=4.08 TRINITY_DN67728_c8_g2_i1:440-1549(-)